MKKTLLASVTTILLLILFVSFKSQDGAPSKSDFAVIKIMEPPSQAMMSDAGMFLSYGDGRHMQIPLKKASVNNCMANADTVATYLNKLKREGYKLKSATGGDTYNTMIFEKE